MQRLKKMMHLVLLLVLCMSVLAGCGEEELPAEELSLAVSVGATPVSLDPIYAQEVADQTILTHLYENLMRVSVDAEGKTAVVNGMAKSVEHEKNLDGTVSFTFKLRDAKWSDGRKVTAADFVYAWRRLASTKTNSPYGELLHIVAGYDEARAADDMSLLQVTAKNESTLVVNLTGHYDWFLREVCTSPATMPLRQDVVMKLKEAAGENPWWSDPAALITNGAYCVSEYERTEFVTLERSETYSEKKNGPKDITFRFASAENVAQKLYETGEVDVMLPMSEARIAELAADESWAAVPEMGVHTVLFNSNYAFCADSLFRQALSMVIDREALTAVAGVTARAAEGLIPFGVPESEEGDFRTVGGPLLENDPDTYEARCRDAQVLLNQTGYGGQELEFLYMNGPRNKLVAEELCRQWREELRVQVVAKGVTEIELWGALRRGEYVLAGVELSAVGNDAECFLMDWTSNSRNNVISYSNSAYDTLMSIIAGAADGTARMGCLHDAEELLLSDYALAPLYTHGVVWEVRETLTGVGRDARGWFTFAHVTQVPAES